MRFKEYCVFNKISFIALWAASAFFLLLSSLSKSIYIKLAFRYIYVPVFYWLWVLVAIFFLVYIFRENLKSLRLFIFTCILFNLIISASQLLINKSIYTVISSFYLLYIYAAIYILALLATMWAVYPLLNRQADLFLPRAPLAIAPIFCLSYSIYKVNTAGIVIFGLCVVSVLMAFFFKHLLKKISYAASKVFLYIRQQNKILILFIFLFALVARILFSFILISKTGEDYIIASDDGIGYDQIAQAIAKSPHNIKKILVDKPWPPIYMVFISIIYRLFGRNFYILTTFQSIFGASIAILLYLIGKRMFNTSAGAIAGLLVALSQPLIFVSSILGTEAIYIPMIILALFLLLEDLFFSQKKIRIRLMLSGILFALAAMTLGTITLFPVVIVIFIIFFRSIQHRMSERLVIALQFLIPFLILYLLIKSIYVCETDSLESHYETAGIALWSQGTSYGYSIDPDNRKFIELGIEPFRNTAESLKIALLNWRKTALIALEIFPVRIRNLFLWGNYGFFDPIFLVNSTRLPNIFSSTLEFYVLIFFFLGLFFSFKNARRENIIFILMFIGYYVFIHAILFISHTLRYGCPIKPFSILFLSYGLYLGYQFFFRDSKFGSS